jgi:hypothetical protein
MLEKEEQEAQLPLEGAGAQLALARMAAGKTLADISRITRISERQLGAIEAGDFAALPSRAYATGFTRSYAKVVGLDGDALVAMVHEELARSEPDVVRRTVPSFEPGDPARLPGGKVAWFAAIGLLLVLLIGFLIWPNLYAPGGSLPSILPSATPRTAPVAAPAAPQASGPVVFTATRDQVWVRFADGNGQQLLQKVLVSGESWTVPDTAAAVTLTTARPDALAVTIGGKPFPPLADREQVMRDIPVSAAALLARGSLPAPMPLASPVASATSESAAPGRRYRPTAVPSPEPSPVAAIGIAPIAAATTGTADSQD